MTMMATISVVAFNSRRLHASAMLLDERNMCAGEGFASARVAADAPRLINVGGVLNLTVTSATSVLGAAIALHGVLASACGTKQVDSFSAAALDVPSNSSRSLSDHSGDGPERGGGHGRAEAQPDDLAEITDAAGMFLLARLALSRAHADAMRAAVHRAPAVGGGP